MAGEVVTPIRDIPGSGTPTPEARMALDNGVAMFSASLASTADAIRPVASEAEATAGVDTSKVMSSLGVKQSIASEIGVTVASKAQGDAANTAVQPARSITAGTGLAGGGDLSANRTLSLSAGSIASLSLADSATQPGDLAAVATSGSYNDLSNKPTIPPGTVTSVGVAVPASMTVSGSPVTAAGTITLAHASGYQGFTATQSSKLAGIQDGAQVNAVASVAGKTGAVTLNSSDVGLGSVDNTSDAAKPVSTATQTALDLKANAATTVSAGTGLTGGGSLSASRTISLSAPSIASLALADSSVQPARTVAAGAGLTGGGTLAADRAIALNAASIASLAKADTAVQPAITISPGTGLAGGGNLAANRTLALSTGSIASLALADSSVQPGGAGAVPSGGSAGQVLVKNSNTSYDLSWISTAAATAVSYASQTLTAPQQTQARTNISAQALNSNLTALSGLTFAADQFAFATGPGAMAIAAVTSFARQILDDANGAAVWATLGGAGSSATNGYFKLPNGLMVQWGRAASAAADFVITFPTAFPAALYSLVATPSYLAGATELVAITTASQTRLQFSAYRRFTAGAGVSGTTSPEVWWVATGV